MALVALHRRLIARCLTRFSLAVMATELLSNQLFLNCRVVRATNELFAQASFLMGIGIHGNFLSSYHA